MHSLAAANVHYKAARALSAWFGGAPTITAVADAAGSERINITLPRGVMDDLKRHALSEGRSCGNLAAYLLEEALRRHRSLG